MSAELETTYHPRPGDLERRLSVLFPNEGLRNAARAQLMRYGRETWHREPERVRLAILKLSGGDLLAIERQVEAADIDYRDILAQAEYPAYSKLQPGIDPTSHEAEEAMRADRQQYLDWMSNG